MGLRVKVGIFSSLSRLFSMCDGVLGAFDPQGLRVSVRFFSGMLVVGVLVFLVSLGGVVMVGVLDLLVTSFARVSLVGIGVRWLQSFPRVLRLVCLDVLAPEATGLLQKLDLNPTGSGGDVPGAKKAKPVVEHSGTHQVQDYKEAAMYYGLYPAYIYGGYGGWGECSAYLSHDGVGTLTPGAYGEMYYGYSPYGYSTLEHVGQVYGSQDYQYPSTNNKRQNTTGKPLYNGKIENQAPSLQGDVSTNSDIRVKRQSHSNLPLKSSQNRPGSSGQPSGRFGSHQSQTSRSSDPYYDRQKFSDKHEKLPSSNPTLTASNSKSKGQFRNQDTRRYPHLMNLHTPTSPMGPASIYSASGMHGYNCNSYDPSLWYGSHMYASGSYGGWNALSDGKYKPRERGNGFHVYGNGNLDGLIELKRGPRSATFRNQQEVGATAAVPVRGQDLSASNGSPAAMKDQYNSADFVETYSDAKFFIIKSYSEDDVHKSIKYNVWASTNSGNKKLDSAYQEAKEKSSDSSVFLLFSVNSSGQFVGLAEMVGRVDFSKTVEHWQQDKWTGCFPVKWHIVKDVPNNLLKHIILENNENKPVTNSRDTHEVKLEHGLKVLKIFKDHACKTSILDDFSFYDNREKIMHERKANRNQSLKKVMDAKLLNEINMEKDMFNGKPKPHELVDIDIDVLNKETAHGKARQQNDAEENGMLSVSVNGVAPTDDQSPTEKLAVANGC